MKQAGFRPEIEGLRAVAATLVAVFHIWMGRPSGAVDVFFVVSGFLITSGLLTRIESAGRIDFARFWARLIKRLWPAALLVLLAVIVTSLFLLPTSRWKETILEVAASAFYFQNWVQAQNETGSPVLHYWALSMQGQFYFLWPFVMALAAWLASRLHAGLRRTVSTTLIVIFVVSFAYSVVLTAHDQPFAYFNTFARMWEFGIGALLATWGAKLRLPRALALPAGWLGLGAIMSCGLLFEVASTFPGYAALWPTMGAALVILAAASGGALGADRFLGSKPMVWLGGISYGIYLWHFPILIFTNLALAPRTVGLAGGLAIIAASVTLAWLTTRLLEKPIRDSRVEAEKPWRAYALGAAAVLPVAIGLAIWTHAYFTEREHARTRISLPDPAYPGAQSREPGFKQAAALHEVEVFPGPLVVASDNEFQSGGSCEKETEKPRGCSLGAKEGRFTLAVVGGSHSAQWLPALREIALRSGWKLLSYTRTNCPFHLGDSVLEYEIESCREWNERLIEELARARPNVVFTTSTLQDDGAETVPASFVAAWRRLDALGIMVIALRDNPKPDFDVSACVELHGAGRCAIPRARLLAARSPTGSLRNVPPNVRFADLTPYFCDDRSCFAVVGNVMVYRKLHHLTATYVRTLTPMLQRELRRAMSSNG